MKRKREGKEIKKNKIDRKKLKKDRKKKWIWKMLQDTFKENGNGTRILVNSQQRRKRREERERRRRSDNYKIQILANYLSNLYFNYLILFLLNFKNQKWQKNL